MTSEAGRSPFIVEPYLQIGNAPRLLGQEQMTVMWHTKVVESDCLVEFKADGGDEGEAAWRLEWNRVAVESIPAHRVYRTVIDEMRPGGKFEYQIFGYAHSYQVPFPLKFHAAPKPQGPAFDSGFENEGSFIYDETFDGRENTKPDGVLFITIGGKGMRASTARIKWTIRALGRHSRSNTMPASPVQLSGIRRRQADAPADRPRWK